MKAFSLCVLLAICSVFLPTQFSLGQAVYGNIVGTVSDATGAAVQSAAIEIADLDRGPGILGVLVARDAVERPSVGL